MDDPVSTKALIGRRARLLGGILRAQETIQAIECELRNRGLAPSEYHPLKNRKLPNFRHGEMKRCCMAAFRQANTPLSMRQLVEAMLRAKGIASPDRKYAAAVRKRANTAVTGLKRQGAVRLIGSERSKRSRWEIVRTES